MFASKEVPQGEHPYSSLHPVYVTEYPLDAQQYLMGTNALPTPDYTPLKVPAGYRREDLPAEREAIRLVKERKDPLPAEAPVSSVAIKDNLASPIQSFVNRFVNALHLPSVQPRLILGGAR